MTSASGGSPRKTQTKAFSTVNDRRPRSLPFYSTFERGVSEDEEIKPRRGSLSNDSLTWPDHSRRSTLTMFAVRHHPNPIDGAFESPADANPCVESAAPSVQPPLPPQGPIDVLVSPDDLSAAQSKKWSEEEEQQCSENSRRPQVLKKSDRICQTVSPKCKSAESQTIKPVLPSPTNDDYPDWVSKVIGETGWNEARRCKVDHSSEVHYACPVCSQPFHRGVIVREGKGDVDFFCTACIRLIKLQDSEDQRKLFKLGSDRHPPSNFEELKSISQIMGSDVVALKRQKRCLHPRYHHYIQLLAVDRSSDCIKFLELVSACSALKSKVQISKKCFDDILREKPLVVRIPPGACQRFDKVYEDAINARKGLPISYDPGTCNCQHVVNFIKTKKWESFEGDKVLQFKPWCYGLISVAVVFIAALILWLWYSVCPRS